MRRRRRGFTLLEALMACGILLAVVVSVTTAITAGQQQSYEAQQRIVGTLAAEELLGRLIIKEYDALPAFHGYTENVGGTLDMNGQPMPELFDTVGRDVQVVDALCELEGVDVKVRGREVSVRAFDSTGRTLAEVETFVPEPAEQSQPEGGGN